MNVSIYIENERLDLFQDETIEVTSSVQNVNDITKNTIDYSKNFTVPASLSNNLIFKHWYDSDIDNGFDARLKVNGRIEIGGIVFKYGKFSLLSVKLKQNKPTSYSLVFYGNGISLVDRLGNDELSSLDLTAFDHVYNDVNLFNGLLSGLFNGDIKYPLMVKKTYYYNSSAIDDGVQGNDNVNNIAYVPWANGIDWKDLRASIRLIRIIEAIEVKYGITFSRDFFNRVEFFNLYLWLDNEKQKEISSEIKVDFDNTGNIFPAFTDYVSIDLTNNSYIFLNQFYDAGFKNYLIKPYILISPSVSYENVPYQVLEYYNNDLGVTRDVPTGGVSMFQTGNPTDKNVSFRIKTNSDFKFRAGLRFFAVGSLNRYTNGFAEQTIAVNYEITNQLPKLKTIDFLKGLFSMFKLVFVQEKSTDPIYVNTLKDYYSSAVLYDITRYVSTSELEVERGKLLSQISYKYEDPQTILNKQFKENEGIAYGDNDLKLVEDFNDPNSKPIDGEKEEVKLPFEQVLYERLTDSISKEKTEVQYGAILDEKYEPVNIKPLLHYIVNQTLVLKGAGVSSTFQLGVFNMPCHTIDLSNEPSHSLVFDRENNTYTNIFIENTLFKNYHEDYVTSIFNSKKRNYKFNAKLPLRIILNLKLKDVLKINESYFRINTWTYNLITGICKLDLINSFDNTINAFKSNRTIINAVSSQSVESIVVSNFTNLIFDYTASWISSATYLGNNVYFGIDANDTGLFRTEIVTLINADTLAEIEITINQNPNTITFGNEIILFGETNLTFES